MEDGAHEEGNIMVMLRVRTSKRKMRGNTMMVDVDGEGQAGEEDDTSNKGDAKSFSVVCWSRLPGLARGEANQTCVSAPLRCHAVKGASRILSPVLCHVTSIV